MNVSIFCVCSLLVSVEYTRNRRVSKTQLENIQKKVPSLSHLEFQRLFNTTFLIARSIMRLSQDARPSRFQETIQDLR